MKNKLMVGDYVETPVFKDTPDMVGQISEIIKLGLFRTEYIIDIPHMNAAQKIKVCRKRKSLKKVKWKIK